MAEAKKDQLYLAIGLVAVLIVLVLWKTGVFDLFGPRRSASPVSMARVGGFRTEAVAVKRVEEKRPEPAMAWGRDPFVRDEVIAGPASSVGSLRLMGITTGKKAKAVINNEIVPLGGKIGTFTVTKITKTAVVVTDGRQDYTLSLE